MNDTTDTPAARCPNCSAPVTRSRFCGACGALLDDVRASRDDPPAGVTGVVAGQASAGQASADQPAQRPLPRSNTALARVARDAASRPTIVGDTPASDRGGTSVERRTVLMGLIALGVGGLAGVLGARRYWPQQVLDVDGLPTAPVELGVADELAAQIDADGPVVIPDEDGGGGRIAVVRWDPSYVSERGSARERYGPDGEDHPVLDLETGLMVLSLVSTHLGCRVHHCASSAWFEDPCHGSKWNAWGEWTGGPAPRGLDRYAAHVRDDGMLVAELTQTRFGPDRESGVLDQEQEGPFCDEA